MPLKNKVVLITGASQGLGKCVALKLSREGVKLALIARTESLLKEVWDGAVKNGAEAEYFVCDIRKLEQIKETVAAIKEKCGAIDVLINNAGVWTENELEKSNPELRRNALETNVLGHINFTYEILPMMQEQNMGHILNVISTSGAQDIPAGDNSEWRVYGASKWAMVGFSKDLANSLRDTKIKVTQFLPGGFESNLYENAGRKDAHNQPWMMQTEDVADVLIFTLTRPEDVYMEKVIFSKLMP